MPARGSMASLALALCLFAAANARAQSRPAPPGVAPPSQMMPQMGEVHSGYASVTVIVADESGINLGEQALVKLSSDMNGANLWGTTQDRSQVMFNDVSPADYQIEVSAAGYESATRELNVVFAEENYDIVVRLKRDPSAVEAAPAPGQLLIGRGRKEAQKAIAALSAGKLKEAQKHLERAYKADPRNADINYLRGLLYVREKKLEEAQNCLEQAITADQKHVRALTLLGQLRLEKKDYPGAIAFLQRAVAASPGFWVAHWLLSDAYLKNGEFEKSREQAEQAIQKGKGAASVAEVVLGEALGSLGRNPEAIQAFQAFLQEDPHSPAAESVRKVISQLQGTGRPAYQQTAMPLQHALPAALPAPASADAGLSIPTWQPPNVDDEKLTLAAGAVCPSAQVLRGAGQSAEELVGNVGRFEATEEVLDQQLNVLGKAMTTARRKFDYMASISKTESGVLKVDEYRTSFSDQGDFPDHISTRGLAALGLVFDPLMRSDYDMTCEGLGAWKGQATWVVYFRQRADRPDRFMRYDFTDASYAVALKGRAWISADNFHIVHLETDLLSPMPKIQLLSQHQAVDYGPVDFTSRKIRLWLPKNAEIYFDFRRHRYYRREGFSAYKLFSVGTTERIDLPKMGKEK